LSSTEAGLALLGWSFHLLNCAIDVMITSCTYIVI
jgi:hypothetical protein